MTRVFGNPVAFGAALLLCLNGWATTMVAASLDTLSQGADLIVQGTVIDSKARLTEDGRRVITDTRIQVAESLKGAVSGEITVMQPGGVVGEIGQRVEGAARFTAGEEVVVFLEKRGPKFALVGMSQGKFQVQRSSDGKSAFAVPQADPGMALVAASNHQAEIASPLQATELNLLKSKIATAVKAKGTTAPAPAPVRTRP